ncbi:hypothetical protein SBA4_4600005 [Candidatus Sulfopaludibacter sp. SbA4]|nr:hypothetical protein SBA4_4600005 [Candidatus Sulfopaludibacter sp. SbA4]
MDGPVSDHFPIWRFHSPDPAGTPPHGARTVFQVQPGQGGQMVEARSGGLACVAYSCLKA